MPKVLMLSPHAARFERLLRPLQLPDIDLASCLSIEEARHHCGDAEIVFGAPDAVAQLLPDCTQLRWVQSSWAGVKPLIIAERRDYLLTGVKGIFGPLMSEYVLGWVLAFQRNILDRAGRRHWDDTPDTPLRGKRLGIMGTGSIGAHVAARCHEFGLHVTGLNTSGAPVAGFDQCFSLQDRAAFFRDLDILVALLPDTPGTTGLVNRHALSLMRPGSLFINAGRANTVVQDELLAMLDEKALRAAVLDVFDKEPVPHDSPLWSVERLFITSHTAAPTLAQDIAEIFCDNYRRYMAKEPLQHQIDFRRGY